MTATRTAGLPAKRQVFFFIVLLVAFALSCHGQDPKSNDKSPAPKMEMRTWSLDPRFDWSNSTDDYIQNNVKEALANLPTHPVLGTDFVSHYFEMQGIVLPPGSEGICSPGPGILVVRSDEKTVTAIDAFLKSRGGNIATIGIEVSAVECAFPPDKNPLSYQITCASIEKLPPRSIKLLDSISASVTFNDRAIVNHFINPPAAAVAGKNPRDMNGFVPGESGTILEFEPILRSDGRVDLNMAYRFRKLAKSRSDNTAFDVQLVISTPSLSDEPRILNISAAPDGGGKFIVVIARAHVTYAASSDQKTDITAGKSPQATSR